MLELSDDMAKPIGKFPYQERAYDPWLIFIYGLIIQVNLPLEREEEKEGSIAQINNRNICIV